MFEQSEKTCPDIQENIEKVIVGKSDAIRLILIALMAGGHVLIEDVGSWQTTLVSCLARSLIPFKRIQFTPDILPSDITGFQCNFKQAKWNFTPV